MSGGLRIGTVLVLALVAFELPMAIGLVLDRRQPETRPTALRAPADHGTARAPRLGSAAAIPELRISRPVARRVVVSRRAERPPRRPVSTPERQLSAAAVTTPQAEPAPTATGPAAPRPVASPPVATATPVQPEPAPTPAGSFDSSGTSGEFDTGGEP